MSHQYKAEADASHARKLKSYGGTTSSTVDKANKDGDATNFAGFRALNTSKQAGMSPLSGKSSMSKDTMSRIMRKAGGKVAGATSLKRLDKAPRKGKAAGGGLNGTGQRIGPIPSPDEQQYAYDSTTRVKPGEMSPGTTRKNGGKIQDYEARSHESQGAQGLRKRQAHAKGGKAFEGSAKDEKEDKKLEKKYGMTHKEWEASDLDKKHDRQESMEGLKKGGRAKKEMGGTADNAESGYAKGGRAKRAIGGGAFDDYMDEGSSAPKSGGKKGAGKTTVNIMIGQGGQQPQQPNPMAMAALLGAMDKGGPGGPPPMAPPPPNAMPPGAMPAGATPPVMPQGASPPVMPQGATPPGPMMRASGGRTNFTDIKVSKPKIKDGYPALDAGAGGGKGRREKILAYGTKGPKGDSV